MIQMVTNVETAVPVPVSTKHPIIQPSSALSSTTTQKENIKQPVPVSPTQIDNLDSTNTVSKPQVGPEPSNSETTQLPSSASSPTPTSTTAATPSSTAPKKKKKRKNNTTVSSASSDSLDESKPLPNESSIKGDGVDQWRARAVNRRALLAKAQEEKDLLSAELTAALARVSDAEHAEATVNKGLLTARAVITQRDRALAELTASTQELKGEHAKLLEEKKRADKRLVILKTVSANLQEAREERDNAVRKLDDANSNNAKLSKDVEQLRNQVESMNMLKQQLSKSEQEVDELARNQEELQKSAKRDSARAAGLGAAGVVAVSLMMRILTGGGRK